MPAGYQLLGFDLPDSFRHPPPEEEQRENRRDLFGRQLVTYAADELLQC